jgi:hypothetical protein
VYPYRNDRPMTLCFQPAEHGTATSLCPPVPRVPFPKAHGRPSSAAPDRSHRRLTGADGPFVVGMTCGCDLEIRTGSNIASPYLSTRRASCALLSLLREVQASIKCSRITIAVAEALALGYREA